MPTIDFKVPEEYMSITRPVAMGIAKSIVQMTGLPIDRIMYNGNLEADKDLNSIIGEGNKNHPLIRNTTTTRIDLKVTENYDEGQIHATPVHQRDALSLFQDNALGITIRPIYSTINASLEFTIRTDDYRTASTWLADQKKHLTQGRTEHMHDIPFQYPMPKEFILVLDHLYKLRESQAGYGESWDKWFKDHLSEKATVLTKMDGAGHLLVFDEVAQGILGWWEFIEPPEHQKSETGATREFSFTYKYQYSKPTHMTMTYPITVHNQPVDLKYIGPEEFTRYGYFTGDRSLIMQAMDVFRREYAFYDYMLMGLRIPTFDEWYPFRMPMNTAVLGTVLCSITPDNRRDLISLTELVQFGLRTDLLAYLSKYHADISVPKKNPFVVLIFEDGMVMHELDVVVSEDLTVSAIKDLDLRKTYHVVIGMVNDLSLLTESAVQKLRHEPDVLHEIISALDPSIPQRGLLPKVLGGRVVSHYALKETILQMRKYPVELKDQAKTIWATVNNLLIATERSHAVT